MLQSSRHEEEFFHALNRVSLPTSSATRNEDEPNPCDVKLN